MIVFFVDVEICLAQTCLVAQFASYAFHIPFLVIFIIESMLLALMAPCIVAILEAFFAMPLTTYEIVHFPVCLRIGRIRIVNWYGGVRHIACICDAKLQCGFGLQTRWIILQISFKKSQK